MTLHKSRTNSEELQKLWVREDMISEDSSEVVEDSDLPFKVKQFIKRVKKIVSRKGPLTTEELEEAEMYWMQVEQRQCYSKEFETDGSGPSRQIVQKIIKGCLICRGYSAKSADQLASQLPEVRIAQTPPFYTCGVDFAGPIYVKNLEGMQKSYVVLFTCATTRALHLELATTMTTESFLMAFRRFISRRGNCRIMYSDNAKTFKKSNREFEQISKILLEDNFHDFICNQRITWKFIVEREV
ncbi:hypothetical protein AVEN_37737-1 [Araneus ventricosus]|uniref:Integrase catalytic domain-containing protein n=1 Tax=Araneus ventricosus TaxID=182803 RepID=A0A4Y2BVZ3_ARAVE|nr:hypothetical protein AVEN_37737-1 [Araneus ventricosus]